MTSPSDPEPTRTPPSQGKDVVHTGWLVGSQMFGAPDERRIKRAFGASAATIILHGVFLVIALLLLARHAASIIEEPRPIIRMVFMDDPGPGGGGGGSPAPAPPEEVSIPPPEPREPIPITPPPPTEIPPPPIPRLTAPVMTPNADVIQASGESLVSLTPYGGGGRGEGVGSGSGDGVGPGTGGGFGGGAYGPGSGVTPPTLVREVKPAYTSEAMRLKLQGTVRLEVVIIENGTVGDVRIVKSLDAVHGLDEEAIKAARQWLFTPARDRDGNPVAYLAPMELDFRLH